MTIASPIMQGDRIIGVICGPGEMKEIVREPHGDPRWCFTCRQRRSFEYVVTATVEPSYYAPNPSVVCATCGTDDGDMFPGRFREWVEE